MDQCDIEHLWKSDVLGDDPKQLSTTVLFLLGLNLVSRAGKEHKNLCRPGVNSQLKIVKDGDIECIQYMEDCSTKCNKGGLKHNDLTGKNVMIYPADDDKHCPVGLYKKYVHLLPRTMKYFELYLQANSQKQVLQTGLWYRDRAIEINTISHMVKDLFLSAGIDGYFTNHSLRHTAVTLLHNKEVPEQTIAEVNGHRSLAIRRY